MQLGFNSQSIDTSKAHSNRFHPASKNFTKLTKLFEQKALADSFDWRFYIEYYEDLDTLSGHKAAYEHWIVFGQFENRLPNKDSLKSYFDLKKLELPEDFDPEKYWLLNPDLQEKFATHQYRNYKVIDHFLRYGQAEGRPYRTSFDWKFYLEYNDGLDQLTTAEAAYEHWLAFGQIEGRFASEAELVRFIEQRQTEVPEDFDPEVYFNLNLDLQKKLLNHKYKQYKAIEHFLSHGKAEGRYYSYIYLQSDCAKQTDYQSSPALIQQNIKNRSLELHSALFNIPYYLQHHPQLVKDGASPLIHFIQTHAIADCDSTDENVQWLNEAITLYCMALQLQPYSSDVVSRLKSIVNYKTDSIQKDACGDYECDDDVYAQWLRENAPSQSDLLQMTAAVSSFRYKPLISVILPVYNTPEAFLREAIQSVLNQIYPNWELCIADDRSTQSHVRALLKEYAAKDSRIKVVFRETNGHISACSNSALAIATGEFVTLLDHDDVLTPDALYEVAVLLNQHPEADMIYSDEDKLNERGRLINPYFKPDWCPDTFLTRMYTCHLGTYRRSLISKVGQFRVGYEGSQDYDLVLRVTEQTNKIFHIPKILYHWRMHASSTASSAAAKPYAYEAAERSLKDALQRRGETGKVISHCRFPGLFTIRYQICKPGLVSIIIPTKNLSHVLAHCLESIFANSTYSNYEVIVIDNGSDEPELLDLLSYWRRKKPNCFRFYTLDIPFNYSRINNFAATKAKGEYLLFLNNDTEVITSDWIEAMVEQAQRPSIGAVGAMLLYPDGSIQHAGVILGLQGVANHGHRHFSANIPGYFSQIVTTNNYSAVTGACLMCRRNVFEQIGGFDEQLAVAYNDVDLCLKMIQRGYRNIYLPHVKLYHYESKSRGYEDSIEKVERLQREASLLRQRWQKYIQHDPCYSPHLTRETEDYRIQLNSNTSIEVLEVIPESPLDPLLDFSIDEIRAGAIYKNFVPIQGWILSRGSVAIAIEVVHAGKVARHIPVGESRPDVEQLYPDIVRSGYSGFMRLLGVATMPSMVQLSLRAVLANEARLTLGTLQLKITF